jgi:hypothetical protein
MAVQLPDLYLSSGGIVMPDNTVMSTAPPTLPPSVGELQRWIDKTAVRLISVEYTNASEDVISVSVTVQCNGASQTGMALTVNGKIVSRIGQSTYGQNMGITETLQALVQPLNKYKVTGNGSIAAWFELLPTVPTAKPLNFEPFTDGGPVKGRATALIINPSRKLYSLNVIAQATAASVGAVIDNFARSVSSSLAAGNPLFDLGNELGFTLSYVNGKLIVEKPTSSSDPMFCLTPPCFNWGVQAPNGVTITGGTKAAAIANLKAYTTSIYDPQLVWVIEDQGVNSQWGYPADTYKAYWSHQPELAQVNMWGSSPRSPDNPSTSQSSIEELVAAVKAKTSWSSNSAISRALVQAGKDYGFVPEYSSPIVTGPATTSGSVLTTFGNDGSSSTTTSTYNQSYAGANITTTKVTVTTTTDRYGGSNTTTVNGTPVTEEYKLPASGSA